VKKNIWALRAIVVVENVALIVLKDGKRMKRQIKNVFNN